jgi:hypothetical protein
MPARIVAYHRTEELQDGTFISQVQILSPSGEDALDYATTTIRAQRAKKRKPERYALLRRGGLSTFQT